MHCIGSLTTTEEAIRIFDQLDLAIRLQKKQQRKGKQKNLNLLYFFVNARKTIRFFSENKL